LDRVEEIKISETVGFFDLPKSYFNF